MKFRMLGIMISALTFAGHSSALTVDQFTEICDSIEANCTEHPLLQAYVGGALDLIAVLDEETEYLQKIYCDAPENLFKVPNIIRYIEANKTRYADRNAMLLVVRYLEENSGC